MSGKRWIWAVALIVLPGCHHDNAPDRADAFASEPAIPPARQFVTAQAATGARDDAMLRAMHFDGGQLNSLGRQKLDLMTQDPDGLQNIVVYLDLPPDAVQQARQAVSDFMKSVGMRDGQFRIEEGPNPSATAPAARAIESLHHQSEDKKDSNSTDNGIGYQPSTPSTGSAMKDVANH